MKNASNVGSKIKSIRESRNIAQEELAQRAGLGLDQIVRIEENQNLPSLAPLVKIARVLGVRLGTFLDDNENLGPVVCKKGQEIQGVSFSSQTAASHNNLNFYPLAQSKVGRHMEPFLIDIDSASQEGYQLSTHEGEEFLYVLKGQIEVTYGNTKYRIEEGESIYYDSIVEHNVHAANESKATILAVVYTPY
jgi:transcriptional regulator with XRE-family HTH domain